MERNRSVFQSFTSKGRSRSKSRVRFGSATMKRPLFSTETWTIRLSISKRPMRQQSSPPFSYTSMTALSGTNCGDGPTTRWIGGQSHWKRRNDSTTNGSAPSRRLTISRAVSAAKGTSTQSAPPSFCTGRRNLNVTAGPIDSVRGPRVMGRVVQRIQPATRQATTTVHNTKRRMRRLFGRDAELLAGVFGMSVN